MKIDYRPCSIIMGLLTETVSAHYAYTSYVGGFFCECGYAVGCDLVLRVSGLEKKSNQFIFYSKIRQRQKFGQKEIHLLIF